MPDDRTEFEEEGEDMEQPTLHPAYEGRKVKAKMSLESENAMLREDLEKSELDVAYYRAQRDELAADLLAYEKALLMHAMGEA